MSQQRQPRGQSSGGQFAPDSNPESALILDGTEVEPLTFDDWISIQESEIEVVQRRIEMTDSNDEEIDSQAEIIGIQEDMLRRYKERVAELEQSVAPVRQLAYGVDEAVDRFTAWERGEADAGDIFSGLLEIREEFFATADPELVGRWRDLETKIRGYENVPAGGVVGETEDEYEAWRDEREELFQKMVKGETAS